LLLSTGGHTCPIPEVYTKSCLEIDRRGETISTPQKNLNARKNSKFSQMCLCPEIKQNNPPKKIGYQPQVLEVASMGDSIKKL